MTVWRRREAPSGVSGDFTWQTEYPSVPADR
jgi:hypothetical protein